LFGNNNNNSNNNHNHIESGNYTGFCVSSNSSFSARQTSLPLPSFRGSVIPIHMHKVGFIHSFIHQLSYSFINSLLNSFIYPFCQLLHKFVFYSLVAFIVDMSMYMSLSTSAWFHDCTWFIHINNNTLFQNCKT
jgi:hypothetical protein